MGKNILSNVAISFVSGAAGAIVVLILITGTLLSQEKVSLAQYFKDHARRSTVEPMNRVLTGDHEALIIDAVKKSAPAVVSIVITAQVPVIERYYGTSPFDFFRNPFGFPELREGTEERQIGGGSGFLVSADGLIITNKHVVNRDGAEYTVFTSDGTQHKAEVVAKDPVNDLAVLRISGTDFQYLEFGDSNEVQIGQTAIAIGNALAEFQNSVSVGVISGLSRSITAGNGRGQSDFLEGVLQTDAAINPGNSGGPLLTTAGTVIGVNVAVAQGSENIGFAIPGNIAKNVVESVIKTGTIVRPYLGVRYVMINEQIRKDNNLTVDHGALILRGENPEELAVLPGSPADKAGLRENDIILEVDTKKITSDLTLGSEIRKRNVGDTLRLKTLRQGNEIIVDVKLEEIPL